MDTSTILYFDAIFSVIFFFLNKFLLIYSFRTQDIQTRLEITNLHFGGYYPTVKNVLSVQGSGDPWSLLGITQNNTYGVTALYIDGIYNFVCSVKTIKFK